MGQRPGRSQHEDWKYFWSNFPATMSRARMVEYSHRRHWVEQYHEEAKPELGLDQYQGWCWDGFHRHAVTVMLRDSFLVWLERWERERCQLRGRPRPLFPLRPDRPRVPLPELHRHISEWLRCAAIRELIELDIIDPYYSRKL
jgi:SRSO17 transposase